MFYRSIFKQALKVSWSYKSLWLLGFFVALFFGNGGIPDLLIRTENISELPSFIIRGSEIFQEQQFKKALTNFGQFYSSHSLFTIFIFLVGLLIFFFLIWFVIVFQASLIWGVDKKSLDGQEKVEPVRGRLILESFKQGKKYFLSLIGLNFLAKLFIFGLLFIVTFPLIILYFKEKSFLWLDLSVLSSFIILVPLDIIISFLILYASAFIILKKEKLRQSIKKAWLLFIQNWLISLETACLLFFINFCAHLALIILLILFSAPFILLGIIFYYLVSPRGILLVTILGLIFLSVILAFFISFLTVFKISSWIILFRELTGKQKRISKLVRLLNRKSL